MGQDNDGQMMNIWEFNEKWNTITHCLHPKKEMSP